MLSANVIPPELSATIDIRLANDINLEDFEKMVGPIDFDSMCMIDFTT